MNISLAGFKHGTKEIWHRNAKLNQALKLLLECGDAVQCIYENNIVLRSQRGEAVFDKNGNLCELYDNQSSQPREDIANRPESRDLEFEMILTFSKMNE